MVKKIIDRLLQGVHNELVTDIGKEKLRNSKLISDRKLQYDEISYNDLIKDHEFYTDNIGIFISSYIETCVIKLDDLDDFKNCVLYIYPVGGFCYMRTPGKGRGGHNRTTIHKKHDNYRIVIHEKIITERCLIL